MSQIRIRKIGALLETLYYLVKYYPSRFTVDKKEASDRKLVYDFKDGRLDGKSINDIANNIKDSKIISSPDQWWLCCIPASNSNKTKVRFKTFIKKVCSITGLNDGYNLIWNIKDRPTKHTSDDRSSIDIKEYIEIGNVENRNILLIDDLHTTGASFKQVKRKLKGSGVKKVHGLFIGKTFWKEEEE